MTKYSYDEIKYSYIFKFGHIKAKAGLNDQNSIEVIICYDSLGYTHAINCIRYRGKIAQKVHKHNFHKTDSIIDEKGEISVYVVGIPDELVYNGGNKDTENKMYKLFTNCERYNLKLKLTGTSLGRLIPTTVGVLYTPLDCNGNTVSNIKTPEQIVGLYKGLGFQSTAIDSAILSNNIQVIPDKFLCWSNIRTINLPSNLRIIGRYALGNCRITEIDFPKFLVFIGEGAFYFNTRLQRAVFSDGLKVICDKAFEGCLRLTSIELPNSVEYIGEAFHNCEELSRLVIPKRAVISSRIFGSKIICGDKLLIECSVEQMQLIKTEYQLASAWSYGNNTIEFIATHSNGTKSRHVYYCSSYK